MSASLPYAEVGLPIPLEGRFTYEVPEELVPYLIVGSRVIVPFGKGRRVGIVFAIHAVKPVGFEVKRIVSLPDDRPLVRSEHVRFWAWLSDYYMCTEGEVLKAALPANLLQMETADKPYWYALRTQRIYWSEYLQENPLALNERLLKLEKAKKQLALLRGFMDLAGTPGVGCCNRMDLLSLPHANASLLKALIEKGFLREESEELPSGTLSVDDSLLAVLTPEQETALTEIREVFKHKESCLLHGYTASGKTELYMHLIMKCIQSGRNALFLVPEIALTKQLAQRLERVFGACLRVYHSDVSLSERLRLWRELSKGDQAYVVLGARSSIFLPFPHLGLVVVDEEHDSSYKQQDPAPRYNARNAVMVLASFFKAKVLLGTATPSIEAYSNCLMKKSGLVELFSRHMGYGLPEVRVINTANLRKQKRMKSLFSPELLQVSQAAIDQGEQVLFFQNRRGYAPMVTCAVCGWVPRCTNCDVSMTYHKAKDHLRCHYCGYEMPLPDRCPVCAAEATRWGGYGTERIEEDVQKLFPDARIVRMDTDTVQKKDASQRLLSRFEQGDSDILIGTQMVTKGLDFQNVRVVGVLNADLMLNFPDFRAHERAFQMLSQVAGRSGRREKSGLVLLQTTQHDHPVLKQVLQHNYKAFFSEEVQLRQLFSYPPYTRIIYVYVRHLDASKARALALRFAQQASSYFGAQMLGPDQAPIGRLNQWYQQFMMFKIPVEESFSRAKKRLMRIRTLCLEDRSGKNARIHFDVDPV